MSEQEQFLCNPEQFLPLAREAGKVFVAFVSEDCQPCMEVMPEVEEREGELRAPLVVVKAEECGALADHYKVRATPTILELDKGEERRRILLRAGDTPSNLIRRLNEEA